MSKSIFIVGIDLDWITPEPQYPPVVEDVDSYEETLDQIITAGCTDKGFTFIKLERQSPHIGSDQGYFYEVIE